MKANIWSRGGGALRSRPMLAGALALGVLSTALAPDIARARAPDDFEEAYARPTVIESPENFQFELKIGPYRPDAGGFYDEFFGDSAWQLAVELDANLLRIPYVGTIGVGGGWAWARAKGNTLSEGQRTEETQELVLFPLSALGVLRIDVLTRELNIPLIFTGKLGWDFVRWKSKEGSRTAGSGLSHGLRWAVQAALDLNFIEPSAARSLDEQWGINRSFLLFEFYSTHARGKSLDVSDRSLFFGLGFSF